MKTLTSYIILDLDKIEERIEQLRRELTISEENNDSIRAGIEYYQIKELIKI